MGSLNSYILSFGTYILSFGNEAYLRRALLKKRPISVGLFCKRHVGTFKGEVGSLNSYILSFGTYILSFGNEAYLRRALLQKARRHI